MSSSKLLEAALTLLQSLDFWSMLLGMASDPTGLVYP